MKTIRQRTLLKMVVLLAFCVLGVASAIAQFIVTCDIDGSPIPAPITVTVGSPVSFTVAGDIFVFGDPPPNTEIMLDFDPGSDALPAGASMTPALPFTASAPVSSTFDWTPTALQVGTYDFSFRAVHVTSGFFSSSGITVNIISAANNPPVADAGPDQTIECASPTGTLVNLDGTGSTDPDGDPLSYSWTAPLSFSGSVDGPTPTILLLLGTHTITLIVNDGMGGTDTDDVIINVVDTTPPTITLNGANPMTVECSTPYVEPGATASDACDSSPSLTITGSVNASVTGSYTVTYNASDASGNTSSTTRTVNVVDTAPPTIALNGANPMTLVSPAPYVEPGAVATDLCDPSPDLVISGVVNSLVPGTYIITYTATDASGNSSAVERTVNVVAPSDFCSLLSPIVSAVVDLADDSSIPKKVRRDINGATKHLEKALDHCGDEKTEKTFRQVEHGISELERAIERSDDSSLNDVLQGFIDDLVALIEAETEAIVAEALAVAGPDNKHVEKAQDHLAKGLEKLSEGKIHRAIDEFIKAAREATRALEVEESTDPTDDNAVSFQGSGASATPLAYRLFQNYPNPFNPTTMISYELADESLVRLKVYDVLGRELADLVHETQMPGTYQVAFDAQNLPSGVYFYRLEVHNRETGEGLLLASQKMVLAK